MLDCKVFLVG